MKNIFKLFCFFVLIPLPAFAGVSANYSTGGLLVGTAVGDTCDGTTEGAIRYNTTDNAHEFCNGTVWRQVVAQAASAPLATPTALDGYLVLTSASWDGNLGGIAGANANCLSDLTANDWMGKADATTRSLINSTKIKAMFIGATSQHANPSTRYFFAVSGDNTLGGAFFTSNASGYGPNNTQNWSGINYLGGYREYWTGYDNNGVAATWDNYTANGDNWYCNAGGGRWTSNSSAATGCVGASASTTWGRWCGGVIACDQTRRLLCFVHP